MARLILRHAQDEAIISFFMLGRLLSATRYAAPRSVANAKPRARAGHAEHEERGIQSTFNSLARAQTWFPWLASKPHAPCRPPCRIRDGNVRR
jgi:hypothetical protein